MNVLIIGGGGVIGQKLARRLVRDGTLDGREITGLTLADIVEPAPVEGARTALCNIADPASLAAVVTAETDMIYLLAAVVSAHAEERFDEGMAVNFYGVLNVLERARHLGTRPRIVFTSSIAVYGGEVCDPLTGETFLNPQTSYGTQKAIGELLLNDYSRKGFIDGRGFRLPTITVRPGKPNRAASSFMSSIFREPLNGQEAICPVGRDFPHYYLSPRRCVENLVRGAAIPEADLGQNRCMIMPGRSLTIGAMIDAMTAVAGNAPSKLIRFESQPEIEPILKGWRSDFRADKARALGLEADAGFEDNIRYYLEDDMPAGRAVS
ncbi:D-erythronate dehydrogenase [Fulvimarina sp. 2208YS6-2-32]|uniref:D-erythronate dehydrogenase n=1 Tax=Fulvimarina uroteuthidis TaxID=3098149 RepID=A0ABU5I315_9HYPH|nr:D-erythronate dehydrogenase [Fulvimarina sp. 2208YS6-2-32]MDY8109756.1 D-erythronate dehydrogenase [Fulvimarina sp. 2208YS6-2-32]